MNRRVDVVARSLAGMVAVAFVAVVAGRLMNGHVATAARLDIPLAILWAATMVEVAAVPFLLAATRRGAVRARCIGGFLTVVVMAGAVATQTRLEPPGSWSIALAGTLLVVGILLVASAAATRAHAPAGDAA